MFDHNTVFTDGSSAIVRRRPDGVGFVFTNNIIPDNAWAVMGTGAAEGTDTLNRFFPGATFQKNVIVSGNSSAYPAGNFFPAGVAAVGFADSADGDFALAPSSPFRNAGTDGADIGCIVTQLIR